MNNENKKTNELSDRYTALLVEIEDKIAQLRNLKSKMEAEGKETELPKTWEEFCDKHDAKEEFFIDSDGEVCTAHLRKRDAERDKNLLPTRQAAEAHRALMQLHQLRDCYRQGWVPNLGDGNDKYIVERSASRIYVTTLNGVSVFLAFQSKEIAEQFLYNFRDLIEQAGDLI